MKVVKLVLSTLLFIGLTAMGADAPVATTETPAVAAEPESLDMELQKLATDTYQAPAGLSPENLYAVQYRHNPLRHRHEFFLGGAKNFTPDGYTVSNQFDAAYRFYLNDKWFLGLSGSYVVNELSSSGERLLTQEGILPDATFTKFRGDLALGYNLFYGKFRISTDQVFYFDNYVSIGPGLVRYELNSQPAIVGDIGIVGWFGKHFSVRVGLKDYFVKEVRRKTQGMTHNLIGHLDLGYLL